MTRSELIETRKEVQEIITNATLDLRAGVIEFWQWWEITRRAMNDAFMAEIMYRKEASNG